MSASFAPDPEKLAVLRRQRWWREKFEARNSIRHHPDGSKTLIPGGWDHEHCQLCMEVISARDPERRFGYRNRDDDWLCEACCQTHVKPFAPGTG